MLVQASTTGATRTDAGRSASAFWLPQPDWTAHAQLRAVRGKNGARNIGRVDADDGRLQPLTAGDSIDAAPAFMPADANSILFQSSAIERDHSGQLAAVAPSAIKRLNLQSGAVDTLLAVPGTDLLAPRACAGGHLYFMRRPRAASHCSWGSMLLDGVLLPPRVLIKALGALLRPGPRRVRCAPPSWQLVRRSVHGTEQVLADCVVSYELLADGAIVYSNGRSEYHLRRPHAATIARNLPAANGLARAA